MSPNNNLAQAPDILFQTQDDEIVHIASEEAGVVSSILTRGTMQFLKSVANLAVVLLFAGTSVAAIVGASKILGASLQAYLFRVETCQYKPVRAPLKPAQNELIEPEEQCAVDYNQAKRSIADGLGLLIASAPVALYLGRRTFSALKEGRSE